MIFSLITGSIVKVIMPGKDLDGATLMIMPGVVGALIDGFIGKALFSNGQSYASAEACLLWLQNQGSGRPHSTPVGPAAFSSQH